MSISRFFQLTLFQLTQWWAFLHFLFVMTFIPMVILTSKRGMFEDDPSLYELFVGIYGNFLALLPGGGDRLGVGTVTCLVACAVDHDR